MAESLRREENLGEQNYTYLIKRQSGAVAEKAGVGVKIGN